MRREISTHQNREINMSRKFHVILKGSLDQDWYVVLQRFGNCYLLITVCH